MLKGLDVSAYQGDINFDLLKPVVDFIIIKATEGNGFLDHKYLRNQTEARRVGIPLGYYHFARPDLGNTPEAEAEWFCKEKSPDDQIRDGEFLCLDFEVHYHDAVNWCLKFLDHLAKQYEPAIRALLYLNISQTKAFDWTPVINGGYGLWLAQYDYDPNAPVVKNPWPVTAFKQYSNRGKFPGINGNVDADVFYGDLKALAAYGQQPGVPIGFPISDQTILPIVNEQGLPMELQAVRSELYDLRKNKPPHPPSVSWALNYMISK